MGIHSEDDLASAVQTSRRARCAGILLTLLFGALCYWQIFMLGQSAWWKTLHGIAGLSFFAVGLLRWLTASWRLRVFRERAFVPFLRWLAGRACFWGRMSWRAGRR